MTSIVAIDLETTGFDATKDSIIEVGIVRFNGRRVEKEWSMLTKPSQPIPPIVSQLTGITNEMVRDAPTFKSIVGEVEKLVGDLPVLGHSVRFDLSFLQRYGILRFNEVIDTYELASVLLPSASRYSLGALCQILGILPPGTPHRALTDAHMTFSLFCDLQEKALELPMDLVAEFVRLSEPFEWDATWVFEQILRSRTRQPVAAKRVKPKDDSGPLFKQKTDLPPIKPVTTPVALDPEEAASLLEFGGPFAKYFDNYEHRPQQVEMIRNVTQALSEGYHLMVEAGTGTGKSFAYLVPAALWALQNQTRVVISTNTINLQEQLISKDIPDLCAALGIDLRAAVLKGRSNYLCPRRLETLRQRSPASVEEMRVLAKVLVWMLEGGNGDRGEINLNGGAERDIWFRISADNEGCRADVCAGRMGGDCPFYRARQNADQAHLLVVNHALLLADVATGSRVLPDYQYVIVDEAHHMEGATTNALSYRLTQDDLLRLLRELGGTSSGVLGHTLGILKGNLRPSDFALFHQVVERSTDLAFRLDHDVKQYFSWISQFLEEQRDGKPVSNYGQQERVQTGTRSQPGWANVEIAWEQVGETLTLLCNLIRQLHKQIGDLDDLPEDLDEAQDSLNDIIRRLDEVSANVGGMINDPDANQIYWIDIPPNSTRIALNMAPLHIGSLMEKHLWHEKSSVILTSATLTANGDFDYIRSRLNADEADEVIVGSPFDYETSALLYLANDIPEPSDANNYQRAVENTLIRLSIATQGRLLALFTSYAQLKRTSQSITPALMESGIQVFEQGEGASASILLDTFKTTDKAVLLGTRAFWEGVDIPGSALSALVIAKIPFDVPSDPIIAARSETFEDPFNEYSLPEAILRFRQGFGRLIRTATDRGIVVILDRRILTKRYGKMFIESLPSCKLKVGPLRDIPAVAERWLNL